MLRIHTAERIELLVRRLGDLLGETPSDPMTSEWIAAPTEAMRRWVALELAQHLGADAGRSDGVAANITTATPGALRQLVLDADRPSDAVDPWRLEPLTWALLGVLSDSDSSSDPGLDRLADVATYARARRVADLFDRYHVRRSDMVRAWAANTSGTGVDVDGSGHPLDPHQRWQPRLWRAVRSWIGEPSPPERMQQVLDRLHAGTLPLTALPPRLSVFGISTLPGGADFLDVAEGIARSRDVHLFMLDPSATATAAVIDRLDAPGLSSRTRSDDVTTDCVVNPLLRSWGRLHRETAVLIADGVRQSRPGTSVELDPIAPPAALPGPTVLEAFQHRLRCDAAEVGDVVPPAGDRSVQFHACFGPGRQVEAMRDTILHLLAEDATLTEDDIVVVCPDLARFAPIIPAVLGPSAHAGYPCMSGPGLPAPSLRYRIADRSLASVNPLITAFDALMDLVVGRFDSTAVLSFIALPAARTRFSFSDDDLATIGDWVASANVRWGLDAGHRERFDGPAGLHTHSWAAAQERIFAGIVIDGGVLDAATPLSVGDVVPVTAEGSALSLAGRFSRLLWLLSELTEATDRPRPVAEWSAVVAARTAQLLAAPPDQQWQMDSLLRALAGLEAAASAGLGAAIAEPVAFIDLRRALVDHIESMPGRADFYRGGITICSLTPMRWLPHRVVVMLGMDQSAFNGGAIDGDDLAAQAPLLGDHDRRAELRQALLETVLSAGEHLIVLRDGADLRTNHDVPAAVPVAELQDAVAGMVHSDPDGEPRRSFMRSIETIHPRQPFDEREFVLHGAVPDEGPSSFDGVSLEGALARRARGRVRSPLASGPVIDAPAVPVIDLDALRAFLRGPARYFFTERLGLRLPRREDAPSPLLPITTDPLTMWGLSESLISARADGTSASEWHRGAALQGLLPPGGYASVDASKVIGRVDRLLERAVEVGIAGAETEPVRISVEVEVESHGTVLVSGTVASRTGTDPGPSELSSSRLAPKHLVDLWLQLVALGASDPAGAWRAVGVFRSTSNDKTSTVDLRLATEVGSTSGPSSVLSATAALSRVVDLFLRGNREPIPLFAALSSDVVRGVAPARHWIGNPPHSLGEGNESAHLLAFPLPLDELLARPALDSDPPGEAPRRVERFAGHLWTSIADSAIDDGDSPLLEIDR